MGVRQEEHSVRTVEARDRCIDASADAHAPFRGQKAECVHGEEAGDEHECPLFGLDPLVVPQKVRVGKQQVQRGKGARI